MRADVAQIYEQQKAIGYTSELIEGEDDCRTYMESIFSDWQAKRITAVLHEKKGGYAENMPSMHGLRGKSEALGVALHAPVRVTGFRTDGGAVAAVETDQGAIACDAGRGRRRAVGPRLLAHARPPRADRRSSVGTG